MNPADGSPWKLLLKGDERAAARLVVEEVTHELRRVLGRRVTIGDAVDDLGLARSGGNPC